MVGNYLTTLNQPVEKDLQMLNDLGLDPNWDNHDFADQDEPNGPNARPVKTCTCEPLPG
jgi:biotin synthase-like enzyme